MRFKKNRRKRSSMKQDRTLKNQTTLAFIVTMRGRDSKSKVHLHHLHTISSSLSFRTAKILHLMQLKASNKSRLPWIGLKRRVSAFRTPTLRMEMKTTVMKMKISLTISLSNTARSKRRCLLSWSQSTMSRLNGPNSLARSPTLTTIMALILTRRNRKRTCWIPRLSLKFTRSISETWRPLWITSYCSTIITMMTVIGNTTVGRVA